MSKTDEMLTTSEAGRLLGLERDAVIEGCKNGRYAGAIQPNGPGGHWRIPRASVDSIREGVRPVKRTARA